MSGSYVSDDLRIREGDVAWRVRWGPRWMYVYLLLEFQSTVDPFMAVRILTHVGLLYQDLIRRGDVGPDRHLPHNTLAVTYPKGTLESQWQRGRRHETVGPHHGGSADP